MVDLNVAALIVSVLSFIVALPQFIIWLNSRTPTIYLVIDKAVDPFNNIKEVDGLSILYQDSPIGENFYILTAYICYIGNQDIEKKDIIKTIRLELPKKSKVYSCKIISHTDSLEIKKEVLNDEINFNFDLLKSEELFYFEVILNLNNIQEREDFKISSRISGLDSHKTIDYHFENYRLLRDINWLLFWALIWSTLLWGHDTISIKPIDEQLRHYEKKFYFKGTILNSDSIYNKLHIYNEIVFNDNYNNLPVDSSKHLEESRRSIDAFLIESNRADSLLKKSLKSKVDWSNINSYNIFRSETNIIPLKNNYSVKFKFIFHWLELIFVLFTISGFVFFPFEFRRSNRYGKIRHAIDLIREYKKNNITR